MILHSPVSGRPLHADTPHSLSDGAGERWPAVDGIPYLRTDSEGLDRLSAKHARLLRELERLHEAAKLRARPKFRSESRGIRTSLAA